MTERHAAKQRHRHHAAHGHSTGPLVGTLLVIIIMAGFVLLGTLAEQNSSHLSPTAYAVATDTQPPITNDTRQSLDRPIPGAVVTLSARWTDNGQLIKAILETDEEGSLVNRTTVPLNGSEALASFSWQNTAVQAGTTVRWRIYAMDAAGNVGASPKLSFTVKAAVAACPSCPSPTDWGRCTSTPVRPSVREGRQNRTAYECSDATDFNCRAKTETQTCTLAPADAALDAISAARDAIAAADSENRDVSKAMDMLTEAELAYAGGNYTDAQGRAQDAVKAIGAPAGPVPVELITVIVVLIAVVAGLVLYFSHKRTVTKLMTELEEKLPKM